MADHVCPVWVGHLLACPLRKFLQNPKTLLGPHVREGMTALDIGSAMGFFSLPMANMVGPDGKVVCIDMQEKMLTSLQRRARRAGLLDRIETRTCQQDSLCIDDLSGTVEVALASAVIHEVPDPAALFRQVFDALKPGGTFLVTEPKGHVTVDDFAGTIALAEEAEFAVVEASRTFSSHSVVLRKVE
ncbi:MAG: class I SAM-dependent methyltransferase [bacterium]|nr:class I SAM-dependent methyltransferase [bacterium]